LTGGRHDRAKDELTESLRRSGDPTTIAIVIRFIDQMRDITDQVLFRDYSAERFAFGRVATELDAGCHARWLGACRTVSGAVSSGSDSEGQSPIVRITRITGKCADRERRVLHAIPMRRPP
jgi:hypothetical protein